MSKGKNKIQRVNSSVQKKVRDFFSFEEGVDITDDTNVLYRKNIVIKNIIFISNILYTFILTLITIGVQESGNLVLTIIFFPFTFLLNRTLKGLIYEDPKSYIRQQIAMYIASFYMFLISIFIYFKLKSGFGGNEETLGIAESGYILIYYSIIVIALYQNKNLMRLVYPWTLGIVTLIHFTITYDIYSKPYVHDINRFLSEFFVTTEFKDILLRTLILVLFMIAVYSSVQISAYMHDQRKTELIKRQKVEKDFRMVVGDLFDVMLESNNGFAENQQQIKLIGLMARKLAGISGLNPSDCERIYQYATISFSKEELSISASFDKMTLNDDDYENLRKKTDLGNTVIKRVQLSQKCESIIRAHLEGNIDSSFVRKFSSIQNDSQGQIVLLCELYVTLRSSQSYKRAYSHRMTMEAMNSEFAQYVSIDLFERFSKWNQDFDAMYNNA